MVNNDETAHLIISGAVLNNLKRDKTDNLYIRTEEVELLLLQV